MPGANGRFETVKELVGYEPEGMKKDAQLYSAPIADYNLGKGRQLAFEKKLEAT